MTEVPQGRPGHRGNTCLVCGRESTPFERVCLQCGTFHGVVITKQDISEQRMILILLSQSRPLPAAVQEESAYERDMRPIGPGVVEYMNREITPPAEAVLDLIENIESFLHVEEMKSKMIAIGKLYEYIEALRAKQQGGSTK